MYLSASSFRPTERGLIKTCTALHPRLDGRSLLASQPHQLALLAEVEGPEHITKL